MLFVGQDCNQHLKMSLLRAFIAEMSCERRNRKFCGYVFERVSCRGQVHPLECSELQLLIEPRTLTHALLIVTILKI